MAEDHITGLAEAVDAGNDAEAKRHIIALASEALNLARRLVAAAEAIASRP